MPPRSTTSPPNSALRSRVRRVRPSPERARSRFRVVIVPDGDLWFAQGLEIDYGVQGASEEDAKRNFEYGLEATVEAHLQINGTIEGLLKVAPPEVWKEFLGDPHGKKRFYSQVTSHVLKEVLPFDGIDYLVAEAA